MVSEAHIRAARAADYPSSPYAWVITRDRSHELCPDEGRSAVGTVGPGWATSEIIDVFSIAPVRFRIRDEGDIDMCSPAGNGVGDAHPDYGVNYEGLMWDSTGDNEFGPLEDYGRAFGCIEIQYLRDGVWVAI